MIAEEVTILSNAVFHRPKRYLIGVLIHDWLLSARQNFRRNCIQILHRNIGFLLELIHQIELRIMIPLVLLIITLLLSLMSSLSIYVDVSLVEVTSLIIGKIYIRYVGRELCTHIRDRFGALLPGPVPLLLIYIGIEFDVDRLRVIKTAAEVGAATVIVVG